MTNDALDLELQEKTEAISSLLGFAQYCFKKQNKNFWVGKHHVQICNALERVILGKSNRLIINIPPRYSKTELLKLLVAYSMGLYPDSEFILTSYSKTLATASSEDIRNLISQDFYQSIFPVEIKQDSTAKDNWRTGKGGRVYAVGAGGTITGFGAGKKRDGFGGAIIIDDPHKADEASSDVKRGGVLNWFGNTLESRKNTRDTPIIVVMQRLNEDDLSGYLLNGGNGEEWEHLCLPAIDDKGEALWHEMHSIEDLKKMKANNPMVFSGQYMQQPSPEDGSEFERKDIKTFKAEELEDIKLKCTSFYIATDFAVTAPKHGNDPDYTVFSVLGVDGKNNVYLLDVWRKQTTSDKWAEELLSLVNIWRPRKILVEKGVIWNSQKPFIEQRQKETMIYCDFLETARTSDKVASSKSIQGLIRSGRFYMNQDAGYYDECVSEMLKFPNGKHDDFVDTLSLFGLNMHELIGGRIDETLDFSRDLGIF